MLGIFFPIVVTCKYADTVIKGITCYKFIAFSIDV